MRLFRAPGAAQTEDQFRWHRTAAKLLGLPVRDYFGATYIGAIVTWRRDHLQEMYEHIRTATGRSWFLAIARQLHFAEYMLYGIFVEHVLGEKAGHFHDDSDVALISWEHEINGEADLDGFFGKLKPEQLAVMLSSKLHIPVERYREKMPFQPDE